MQQKVKRKGIAQCLTNYSVGDEYMRITFRAGVIYAYEADLDGTVTVTTDEIFCRLMEKVFLRHFHIVADV